MTSNLGSQFISEHTSTATGTLDEGTRRQVMDDAACAFPAEFLNRVDEIIPSSTRSDAATSSRLSISRIAGLMKRLEDRKIHVVLSDRARDELVEEKADPSCGREAR